MSKIQQILNTPITNSPVDPKIFQGIQQNLQDIVSNKQNFGELLPNYEIIERGQRALVQFESYDKVTVMAYNRINQELQTLEKIENALTEFQQLYAQAAQANQAEANTKLANNTLQTLQRILNTRYSNTFLLGGVAGNQQPVTVDLTTQTNLNPPYNDPINNYTNATADITVVDLGSGNATYGRLCANDPAIVQFIGAMNLTKLPGNNATAIQSALDKAKAGITTLKLIIGTDVQNINGETGIKAQNGNVVANITGELRELIEPDITRQSTLYKELLIQSQALLAMLAQYNRFQISVYSSGTAS